MGKSNLNVHSDVLSTSATNLHRAADQAKQQTNAAFGGGHHLADFSRTGFAVFVNGVLDKLQSELPEDIENLIKSYAGALLALDGATTATDHSLAQTAKSERPSPPAAR
jgi:hypothetical protein